MSHKRKEIRLACKQSLLNADTAAGDRIHSNRALPLFGIDFPAINVFALEETARAGRLGANVSFRQVAISIDVYQEASAEDLEGDLDDLANEVEQIFSVREAFGEDVVDAALVGTKVELSQVGGKPAGVVRLRYLVDYIP